MTQILNTVYWHTIAMGLIVKHNSSSEDWYNTRSGTCTTVVTGVVLASSTPYHQSLERSDGLCTPSVALVAADVVIGDLFSGVQAGVEHNGDRSEAVRASYHSKREAVNVVLEHCHVLYAWVARAQTIFEDPFYDHPIVQRTVHSPYGGHQQCLQRTNCDEGWKDRAATGYHLGSYDLFERNHHCATCRGSQLQH